MDTVLVLMATYNGEQYIREQIDSILGQVGVSVDLLIRDDGSTDATPLIINEYESLYDNVTVISSGENSGGISNFLQLIRHATNIEREYHYYAFADQDDVWLPDKLAAACKILEGFDQNCPLLYCSRQTNCDENLDPLFTDFYPQWSDRKYLLTYLLYYPCAEGCTMVFNRRQLECMSRIPLSTHRWHDEWAVVLALLFGRVFADENSYMRRRLHSNNAAGRRRTTGQNIQRRIKYWNNCGAFCEASKDLLNVFGEELSPSDQGTVERVANYRNSLTCRFKLATNRMILGLHWKNAILIRAAIMFGRV